MRACLPDHRGRGVLVTAALAPLMEGFSRPESALDRFGASLSATDQKVINAADLILGGLWVGSWIPMAFARFRDVTRHRRQATRAIPSAILTIFSSQIGRTALGSWQRRPLFPHLGRMAVVMDHKRFGLLSEHRDEARRCLHEGGHKVSNEKFGEFLVALENAINEYHHAERGSTRSMVRAELKSLLALTRWRKPHLDKIREACLGLSREAFFVLERHAARIIPSMFPENHFDGSLRDWIEHIAPDGVLIEAIRALIEVRAVPTRTEPLIIGEQLDENGRLRREGRPREDEQLSLVRHIFHAWETVTGEFPDVKRSDRGIGRLVHDVFDWCGLRYEQATYSLRQYCEEVARSAPVGRPGWVRGVSPPRREG